MEHLPERTTDDTEGVVQSRVGVDRRLPDPRNQVERLADQSKGLVDDVKSWVDLRIKLVQAEVEEKIETKLNEAIFKIVPIVVGAVGALFLLVTLALALGWWLGNNVWGFLIVTVLLFVVAAIIRAVGQRKHGGAKEIASHERTPTD